MNWLWMFLFHPVVFYVSGSPNSYGGKGGLDVGDPLHIFPDNSQGNQLRRGTAGDPFGLWYNAPSRPETPEELAKDEEARKQGLRTQIDQMYGIGDPNASAQMQADQKQVSDATSGYYGDQLSRSVAAAERNNRFNLARSGLSGGSQDANSNAEIQTDQALGATRIDQAARAAAASLASERENERLNADALVNAGAGTQAIQSAQQGLKNSLDNANAAQRTDLTSGLFSGFADNFAMNNVNSANAALLARQQQLGAFFPTKSAGGTVTPSS